MSGAQDLPLTRLREKARRRLEELGQGEAISLNHKQAQEVHDLVACVAAIEKRDTTRRRRFVRVVTAVVVLTMAAVIVLWSTPRPDATFQAEISTDEVAFTLASDRFFNPPLSTNALEIVSDDARTIGLAVPPISGIPDDLDIVALRAAAGNAAGSVSVDTLLVPKDSVVRLQRIGADLVVEMSSPRRPIRIGFTLSPGSSLAVSTEPEVAELRPRQNLPIEVSIPAGQRITLRLFGSAAGFTTRPFPAAQVDFTRLIDDGVSQPIMDSTVNGGTIRVHTPGGTARALSQGSRLSLAHAQPVTTMVMGNSSNLSVSVRGNASTIVVDTFGGEDDLKPRLLSWIVANQPLVLIWGAFFYCATLLIGVLRWLHTV